MALVLNRGYQINSFETPPQGVTTKLGGMWKTPRSTRGVLAQVSLCAAACFSTFDDLLTLTMWTPDGDECHETLLVSGCCQERSQCAINRSPSPHLEHYPSLSTRSAKADLDLKVKRGIKD